MSDEIILLTVTRDDHTVCALMEQRGPYEWVVDPPLGVKAGETLQIHQVGYSTPTLVFCPRDQRVLGEMAPKPGVEKWRGREYL